MSWSDDFESDSLGTIPSGWNRVNDGSNGTVGVDDTRVYSGSRSVHSNQPDTGSPSHWHLYTSEYSPSGDHEITLYANVNGKQNSGSADQFGFANQDVGGNSASKWSYSVNMVQDSDGANGRGIYAADGDGAGNSTWAFVANIQYDVWWRITISVSYSSNSYDVEVENLSTNDVYTETGLGFRTNGNASDFPVFEHINDNYRGWFDDVSVSGLLPPSNLSATAVASDQIDLSWTDNADGETEQRIYHSTDGSSFGQLETVGLNVTSYSHTGLSIGTQHWYYVTAFDGTDESTPSNTDSAITPDLGPPGLTVTTEMAEATATITDSSTSETEFRLYRSSTGPATPSDTLVSAIPSSTQTGTGSTYQETDTGLSEDMTYFYAATAHDGSNESTPTQVAVTTNRQTETELSTEVVVTTDLPAPVVDSVTATGDRLDVQWTLQSTDEDGVRVYTRRTGGSGWTQHGGDLPAGTEQLTTDPLLNGEQYDVEVVVFTVDTTNDTALSPAATTDLPNLPTGDVTVNASAEDEIEVDWS